MKHWFSLLIKSQGRRLCWGILWAAITALSGVSLLMLSGWFITATALAGIAISAGLLLIFDMYMPGSGIRFFALSRTVGRYTERVYNHDTVLRLIAAFRVSIFKGLASLPMNRLRASSDSEWLGKLTADLDALDSILLRYTIAPIAAGLLIIIITVFLSFIDLVLALYLGSFFAVLYLLSIVVTIAHTQTLAEASSGALSDLRADVIEHLQGAFELHSHHLMQHHEKQIRHRLHALSTIQTCLNARVANVQLILDLSLGLGLAALVFLVLTLVNASDLTGPIAVLLVMMFIGTSELLQSIPTQFSTWGKTRFAANRLSQMVDSEQQKRAIAISTISSVSVQLSHQRNVLISHCQLLSFSVSQQHMVLITGRSGTGKSSLASLLSGLESVDNSFSCILINGDVDIDDIALKSWHTCLGYLEQSNAIMAESLGYNLALGLPSVSETQIWTVLKMLELDVWAAQLPDGLNTWLGETGGRVSGGQARRIGLARLLLREPRLLILDEPFNGIDEQMAGRIWQNISAWLGQRMVILLTHETPTFLAHLTCYDRVSLDIDQDRNRSQDQGQVKYQH